MALSEIIKRIKEKKQLSRLDEELVRKEIDRIMLKNKKLREKINSAETFKSIEKSREVEQIVKEARNELNRVYGIYQPDSKSEILSEKDIAAIAAAKKEKSDEMHKPILEKHLSSKERLKFYPEFYERIFKVTGKPKSILDIACGLNPFSFRFMGLEDITYYAIEMNSWETNLIQQYFDAMSIKGKAITQDITKNQDFPKADVCFAFKIFDLISDKLVEEIVKKVQSKYIVASFPTITARQHRMNYVRRGGFERMLKRLKLEFSKTEFENELVYIIKKQ